MLCNHCLDMPRQRDEEGTSTGCCGRSRPHRVRPFSPGNCLSEQVEIRPKRVLRIQHINARPRDARFEKEMHVQLMYKGQGLQDGLVSAGPLTMPKRKQSRGTVVKSNAQVGTTSSFLKLPLLYLCDLVQHRYIIISETAPLYLYDFV